MCIAVAKYFKGTGWVLAKNRDQDYVSTVSFKDEPAPIVGEVMTLFDHDTGYQEGMNHAGLVIITTSLTPIILEETDKEDGKNIRKALGMRTPDEAAKFLVGKKMTGHILVATPEKLIHIEAAKRDQGRGPYESKMRVVPKTETVVVTNHGLALPWAGFQYRVSKNQDIWRQSSEKRLAAATKEVAKAKDAAHVLDALASKVDDDLQMNVFRVEGKPRQMRTIFQWAFVPSESLVLIRPIQTKIKHLKITHDKIHVRVLDNEPVKKIYDGKIRHFTKIELEDDGKSIKTVQTEGFQRFRDFIY